MTKRQQIEKVIAEMVSNDRGQNLPDGRKMRSKGNHTKAQNRLRREIQVIYAQGE